MNQQIKPLERFLSNNNMEMLQEAMPYLKPSYKKSLALFIKAYECNKILHEFDNQETLSACGLNASNPGYEEMLCAMKKCAVGNNLKQIDLILNLLQATKLFKMYQDTASSFSNETTSATKDSSLQSQLNLIETITNLMKGEQKNEHKLD